MIVHIFVCVCYKIDVYFSNEPTLVDKDTSSIPTDEANKELWQSKCISNFKTTIILPRERKINQRDNNPADLSWMH